MSSGNSHDPLQDYIDSLLIDDLLGDAQVETQNRSGVEFAKDEGALKLAAGGNIAPLTASRPARAAARPYAEPIRTLNLRMPLPPIAPPAEETPATEAKPLIETKPLVEAKLRADIKPHIETQPVDLAPPPAIPAPIITPEPVMVPAEPSVEIDTAADLTAMTPPAAWLSNGRPQWAQQPFECLMFKAGGLQLAAPLIELGSIYPLEGDALTEIFGQTQWFMGLMPVKEYNVRAMDTALVVMPERYEAAMRDNYRYVVSLFGSDWGLAVDSVVGTILLDPERVRWRGERGKRPWLAGTLIDHMCALFDIAQVAWLFHNQDRKRAHK